MLGTAIDWLKKMLLEKWGGRVISMALVLLGGYLGQTAIDPILVANWIDATKELLLALLPILLAWVLGMARQKTALMTEPPIKRFS